MSEYIDADKLFDVFKSLPAANVIKVVRNKDCKYHVEGITQNFCCDFVDDHMIFVQEEKGDMRNDSKVSLER